MIDRTKMPTLLAAALAISLAGCSKPQESLQEDALVQQESGGAQWPQGNDAVSGEASMLASAPAGEASAMPPPLDTSRMQPAQIIDRAGFGQPIIAADLEIPAGWQTVGGVAWNDGTDCITNQLQIGWTAMAPDSLTAIEILPGFNWQVAGTEIQMNPCPAAPYRSTREFLEATVQRTRPGARVLDYQDQPEVAQQMAQSAQSHPQAQLRHDAGRVLIAYNKDGVEMREVLGAAITFSQMQGNVVAGTATISSVRGPNGRVDFELGKRVGATMRLNPQWLEAMKQRGMANLQRVSDGQRRSINDWHNRQMAIISARGEADRAAIRMRTNREVAGIYSAIAANTSATSDRMHASNIDTINQVNSYAGVDGTVVKSSIHGGDQVFQNSNDPSQAYSTDEAYPNPPSGYVELERVP
ncbi:hypothetical protein [Luteimonas kalidii]|uniref:Uncharacterized protein n=1 Tax=Luteimonas kalidii TaxID=3042025 RepID=A0ABT6JYC2_9GAMM|nr:hypothetical protein [Luteimonas kalidii]MDH5835705.1 hypothetical protein [Luteimonas kalidii]